VVCSWPPARAAPATPVPAAMRLLVPCAVSCLATVLAAAGAAGAQEAGPGAAAGRRCAPGALALKDTLRATMHATVVTADGDATTVRLLRQTMLQEVASRFAVPPAVHLPQFTQAAVFVRPDGTLSTAPDLAGELAFTLHRDGTVTDVSVRDPSDAAEVDGGLRDAVASAAAAGAFGPLPAELGRDTLQLRIRVAPDVAADQPSFPLVALAVPYAAAEFPALPRRNRAPKFPPAAAQAGVGDLVRVTFIVDEQGKPMMPTVRVVQARYREFIDEVLAVLPGYRYHPARIGGCPVKQFVEQPFQFSRR